MTFRRVLSNSCVHYAVTSERGRRNVMNKVLILIAAGCLIAACGGSSSSGGNTPSSPEAPAGGSHSVLEEMRCSPWVAVAFVGKISARRKMKGEHIDFAMGLAIGFLGACSLAYHGHPLLGL